MTGEELELLRPEIWDHLYINGPSPIDQIADRMQLDVAQVKEVVDHSWFHIRDEVVEIASTAE